LNAVSPAPESRKRSAGFPRRHRLTGTGDFSSVFGFRKAIRSANFLLHYGPRGNGQSEGARLGLVIAKRHLRLAVDRNLIKRLIREAFRIRRADLPSRDLIVRLAVKPDLPIDRQALAEEIRKLLEKCASLEPG
jgi:ribonuclease P protein component